jgi:hypothetical protein
LAGQGLLRFIRNDCIHIAVQLQTNPKSQIPNPKSI